MLNLNDVVTVIGRSAEIGIITYGQNKTEAARLEASDGDYYIVQFEKGLEVLREDQLQKQQMQ